MEVYSSVVADIDYSDETQELTVVWKRTGRVSVYSDVPSELAERVQKSPSIGQALRESVQDAYPHRYI